ncbi:MAG: hypothetical protein ACJASQ_002609 [Crocinitomicaceae bacterium]|jgi:hypothetical protein
MENGIALVLAWPETKCKEPGAWYDPLMELIGVSQSGYYKVGHAAVVLVNCETGICHYFDFGRYHTPKGFGRVRDAQTDHDLKINQKAEFNDNSEILNLDEILMEVQNNSSCHGDGFLRAGIQYIDFKYSFSKAKKMQAKTHINYGPFIHNGTNCSRFVKSVVTKGMSMSPAKIKLLFPLMLSPTPLWNVKAVGEIKYSIEATVQLASYEN